MDASTCHVFAEQELPPGVSRAPYLDFRTIKHLCLVKFAHQRRKDMARLKVVVIAGAIEVGRHGAKVVCAVLTVVRPAHLYPGNLRYRVRPIGRLQRSGKKVVLLYRLRTVARINARRAEEKQLLYPRAPSLVNDIGLDGQILPD